MTYAKTSNSAVFFIFMTILLDAIGFGIILPVTPELIMELTGKGLSAAAMYGGWLWFIFAGMQFFCAPVLGNLSDRFGRRPVILAAASLLLFVRTTRSQAMRPAAPDIRTRSMETAPVVSDGG